MIHVVHVSLALLIIRNNSIIRSSDLSFALVLKLKGF